MPKMTKKKRLEILNEAIAQLDYMRGYASEVRNIIMDEVLTGKYKSKVKFLDLDLLDDVWMALANLKAVRDIEKKRKA